MSAFPQARARRLRKHIPNSTTTTLPAPSHPLQPAKQFSICQSQLFSSFSTAASPLYCPSMPSPASPPAPSSPAPRLCSSAASFVPASQPSRSYVPSADLRDESDDDEYHDDGFDAAHAAYLARRIAEASVESAAALPAATAGAGGGMSPFDESVIDREWEELVNSMKAIVPSQTRTDHNTARARLRLHERH